MSLNEKCAVFGVYGGDKDASRIVYSGLWSLQHRGQENSGITSTDGKSIFSHKGQGLVASVYEEKDLKKLKGGIAIGHNRYSTFGKSGIDHSQPVYFQHNSIALAHNGNLPVTTALKRFLRAKGIESAGLNDSEMMFRAVEYWVVRKKTLEEATSLCYELFTGAFSLLIMGKNSIVATRDRFGIRPLAIGRLNGSYIFSSETCALATIGATFIREVSPGEMVVVDEQGMRSIQLVEGQEKLDVFEFIYFARPDSRLLGRSVYEVRKQLGVRLAREAKIDVDMIIPVPDSAVPAAIGYSQESKIPLEQVMVKNRYIHRTFIKPAQRLRDEGVGLKLNMIADAVKGKRIAIVDDSIVRGSTSRKLAELARKSGASEVHLLIASPPVLYPDYYGINTPKQEELIATKLSRVELAHYLHVDSVHFLSVEAMIASIGVPRENLCTSCFTGDYPIDIGKSNKAKVRAVEYL